MLIFWSKTATAFARLTASCKSDSGNGLISLKRSNPALIPLSLALFMAAFPVVENELVMISRESASSAIYPSITG